jgi:hypothetical protein
MLPQTSPLTHNPTALVVLAVRKNCSGSAFRRPD